MNTPIHECPFCGESADVISRRITLAVGRRKVDVDDEHMHCRKCGESFYTPEQSDRLEKLSRVALDQSENLLTPDRIERVRRSLNLTQSEFDELLGVGSKSSARWESGRVRQNVATDRLIRLLAADRKNVQILAGINGVALPDSCYVPDQILDRNPPLKGDFKFQPEFQSQPPYVQRLFGARESIPPGGESNLWNPLLGTILRRANDPD